MSTGRRVIAILLATLVVLPLATVTLTLIPVSSWVLDRNFYKTLASDTRVYELWQAEKLPEYLIIEGNTSVDGLPADALGDAFREVIAPSYLRDQAVGVIDQSFDILEGRVDSPQIRLDLAPIKATLSGPAGGTFAASLAAGLPVCAAGEEALAPGASIVRCRMAGESAEQTAVLIAAGLPAYVNRLPDQVVIASEDTAASYRFLRFSWLGVGRLGLALGIVVLALITGAFALLAAFLGARSAGGRLQWLGWMLLIPGVLVFLMGPSMYIEPWRNWLRYSWFSPSEAVYAEFYRLALRTSLGTALRTIAAAFMITGAIAGLVGVTSIAVGMLGSRQRGVPRAVGAEPLAAKPQ